MPPPQMEVAMATSQVRILSWLEENKKKKAIKMETSGFWIAETFLYKVHDHAGESHEKGQANRS